MDTGPFLVNLLSVFHPSSHTRDTRQAPELSPWSQVTWYTASCVHAHLCFFSLWSGMDSCIGSLYPTLTPPHLLTLSVKPGAFSASAAQIPMRSQEAPETDISC